MTMLGEAGFCYQLAAGGGNWGELPDGWQFGDVAAVGVDRRDQVYVFSRSEHPVTVFDRDGKFLHSWGRVNSCGRTGCISGRTTAST